MYLCALNIENVLETYNPISSKLEEFWCAFVLSKISLNLTPSVDLFFFVKHGRYNLSCW